MYDVLAPDFTKIGTAEKVSSANYSVYWQEVGGITLIAAATDYNLGLLAGGNYIRVNDPWRRELEQDTVYLIVNVSIDEDSREITVNGKTGDFLLSGRTAGPAVLTNTTASAAVRQLVADNLRGLPMTAAVRASSQDTQIVRYPTDGGAVEEVTRKLLQYCGMGKRVYLENGSLVYAVDGGRDLTGAADVPVFGSGSGAARNPVIAIDSSDYCNVAMGNLAYNDDRVESIQAGDAGATGVNRRELWCGEIMQQSGETDAEFQARAKTEMEGMLAEHIRRTTVTGESAADLVQTYRLGDIVRAKIGGYTVDKRVMGFAWLRDQLNDKVEIKLGDPVKTVIAEIKDKKPVSSAVSGQIGGLKSSVGGVRSSLSETDKKVKLIQEDYKSLYARVDGVVAGMDAYVLNNTLEEYKLAVARTFATIDGVNSALELKAEKDDLENTASAVASLTTRVGDAEASLTLKASQDAVDGISQSVATLQADVVQLQGDTAILGNLTVDGGNLRVSKGIVTDNAVTGASIYANGTGSQGIVSGRRVTCSEFAIGGTDYTPQQITSTFGAVLYALGCA